MFIVKIYHKNKGITKIRQRAVKKVFHASQEQIYISALTRHAGTTSLALRYIMIISMNQIANNIVC